MKLSSRRLTNYKMDLAEKDRPILKDNHENTITSKSEKDVSPCSKKIELLVCDDVPATAMLSTDHTVTLSTDHTTILSTDHTTTLPTHYTATLSTDHTATLSTDHTATLSTDHTATLSTDHTTTLSTNHTATLSTDHTATLSTYHTATLSTDYTATPSTDHTATPSTDHTATPSTDRTATLSTDQTTSMDAENIPAHLVTSDVPCRNSHLYSSDTDASSHSDEENREVNHDTGLNNSVWTLLPQLQANFGIIDKTAHLKVKVYFSQHQLDCLKSAFRLNRYPFKDEYQYIGRSLGVDVKSVKLWFQNRRAKFRKLPMEAQLLHAPTKPTTIQPKLVSSTTRKPNKNYSNATLPMKNNDYQKMDLISLPADHPFCNLQKLTTRTSSEIENLPTSGTSHSMDKILLTSDRASQLPDRKRKRHSSGQLSLNDGTSQLSDLKRKRSSSGQLSQSNEISWLPDRKRKKHSSGQLSLNDGTSQLSDLKRKKYSSGQFCQSEIIPKNFVVRNSIVPSCTGRIIASRQHIINTSYKACHQVAPLYRPYEMSAGSGMHLNSFYQQVSPLHISPPTPSGSGQYSETPLDLSNKHCLPQNKNCKSTIMETQDLNTTLGNSLQSGFTPKLRTTSILKQHSLYSPVYPVNPYRYLPNYTPYHHTSPMVKAELKYHHMPFNSTIIK